MPLSLLSLHQEIPCVVLQVATLKTKLALDVMDSLHQRLRRHTVLLAIPQLREVDLKQPLRNHHLLVSITKRVPRVYRGLRIQ